MARILTLKLTLTLSHTHTFTHTQYTNSLIPAKYAAVNTSSGCGIVSCKDICIADYQFSDGCGPTYQERAHVHHVEHGTWLLELANADTHFAAIDVNEWTLQTTGVCTLCKFCGNGQYNPYCNNYDLVLNEGENEIAGAGRCKNCLTHCRSALPLPEEAYYLHHPKEFKGCHPADDSLYRVSENEIKVQSNYVCAQCAKSIWTQAGVGSIGTRAQIWIVAGCGINFNYWYFTRAGGANIPDPKTSTSYDSDAIYYGQHALLPYCPEGHFYNADISGCDLQAYQADPYKQGQFIELSTDSIVEEDYRLHCCKRCTTCLFPKKANMQYWQQCDGSSLEDTQKHCLDKCPYGFYEKNQTCVLCTSCACGESFDSFANTQCPNT